MAYYDALIAAWNSTQQPPNGVTGAPLTSTMTTQQKIDAVNAWAVPSPLPCIVPTYKIYNAIVGSEFLALGSTIQQLLRDITTLGTVDASSGTQIRARIVSIFPSTTQTFANLQALVQPYDNASQSWTVLHGYPDSNLNVRDCANAGLV